MNNCRAMHICDSISPCKSFQAVVFVLAIIGCPAADATTELLYDTEPNDEITQAVPLSPPGAKSPVKILGELKGGDQDAYYWRVDAEDAGKRWNLKLSGRTGALTGLNIYDLTEAIEASPQQSLTGLTLEAKPPNLFSLSSTDGTQPTVQQKLLFPPGEYVLGVFHSGGEGSYSVDISQADAPDVRVPDAATKTDPEWFSIGDWNAVLAQGDIWFGFELDEDEASQLWEFKGQTPLGTRTDMALLFEDGTEVVRLQGAGGTILRRSGLTLEPGQYRIRSTTESQVTHLASLQPGGGLAEGTEVEPNDHDSLATRIKPGQSLTGDFAGEDHTDFVAFTMTEDHTGQHWSLTLDGVNGAIEVCLMEPESRLTHCRSGSEIRFDSLGLPTADYHLRISQKRETEGWSLDWAEGEPLEAGDEIEPNDSLVLTSTLSEKGFARGHFNGAENDIWRCEVRGKPQLWRAQLQGDSIKEISILKGGGQVIQSERAGQSNRVRLDNLFLMPGEYFLKVSGTDSDYLIRTLALGPPDPRMELEPNDDYQRALTLPLDGERIGTLSEKGDVDVYQFSLAGREHVSITVTPPADGRFRASLNVGDDMGAISEAQVREVGQPAVFDMTLEPGDYSIKVWPYQVSGAEYTIALERLGLFPPVSDAEPNDQRDQATPMPPLGLITGTLGATRAGQDWYRIGPLPAATEVSLQEISGIRPWLTVAGADTDQLQHDREAGQYRTTLEPDTEYLLSLDGQGEYRYDLFDLGLEPQADTDLALEMALRFEDRSGIQAFSIWQQSLSGVLQLNNTGTTALELQLEPATSDYRWQLSLETDALTLAPGERREIGVQVMIPPDALSDRQTRLAIAATDLLQGRQVATVEIQSDTQTLPVNPEFYWAVPEPLRGGLNVAATRLGAEPADSPGSGSKEQDRLPILFDSLAEYGRWQAYYVNIASQSPEDYARPTVDLAGDEPIPVAGFALNPTGELTPKGYLRDFAVALSEDGEHYEVVYEGRLKPVPEEQYFVLPEPQQARFARLIPKTGHLAYQWIDLGEFKVIAEPGFVPDTLRPINIAEHDLGGHLVWSRPWVRGNAFHTSLFEADDEAARLRIAPGEAAELVIGFNHARTARIRGLSIQQLGDVDDKQRLGNVRLLGSAATPLGPWEPLGEWSMEKLTSDISLEEPVWARYLKLIFTGADESSNTIRIPDRLQVFEVPSDESYQSVVGEWGYLTNKGPFEAADTPVWRGPPGQLDNHSRERALLLAPGKAEPGAALLDRYSGWYQLDIPADQNTIRLSLLGVPTVLASPELTDAEGETVPLYPLQQTTPDHQQWQAFVEPGESYWIEVSEPPRSVIFSWDTSGSVGWYVPSIANALNTYAEQIRPGRDVVNLVPFGRGGPLLKNWQGHAYPLKKMLNSWPHDTSSSAAEAALIASSEALKDRPGKKAIVFITDAATTVDPDTWQALDKARPQIFAMGLSSSGAFGGNNYVEKDLMQDWAQVNNGHYEYITSLGALQRGFDRAIVRLRQPVSFEVQADYTFTEDPGPATLAVISGETEIDPGARGAVELILDASGSMLKRMGNQRRIQIAKAAIAEVVNKVLPEGIPLALRVYGHKEAGSCRTDLEQSLAPLNKSQLLGKLDGINAVNLARTPIAASLAKVESDLAGAEGQRWVILLTDGEETCEGDPAAAIQALADKGIEVKLNIVGFAIDDEALKGEFAAWAQAGGGRYFDASEAGALGTALDQALQIPFEVMNAAGEVVAEGYLDGEPVEVPPGAYTVRLETSPAKVFRDVQLAPGDAEELNIE